MPSSFTFSTSCSLPYRMRRRTSCEDCFLILVACPFHQDRWQVSRKYTEFGLCLCPRQDRGLEPPRANPSHHLQSSPGVKCRLCRPHPAGSWLAPLHFSSSLWVTASKILAVEGILHPALHPGVQGANILAFDHCLERTASGNRAAKSTAPESTVDAFSIL